MSMQVEGHIRWLARKRVLLFLGCLKGYIALRRTLHWRTNSAMILGGGVLFKAFVADRGCTAGIIQRAWALQDDTEVCARAPRLYLLKVG